MTEAEKDEILNFLHRNPMGVISTVHKSDGAPESALVAFAETSDFKLIFQTLTAARKYVNLKTDPRVSFVIGWEIDKQHQITLQYEGSAMEIVNEDSDYQEYRKIFEQKKTPCTTDFLDNPKSRLFLIEPRWIGYSDYSSDVPRIIENTFD
ncbi:MAG: pyridoxamine 5'-phosphate oxidase family protein [Candidatus Paceibacterota bacterium]